MEKIDDVAAEAAAYGTTAQSVISAVDLMNVIRATAGAGHWDNNRNAEKLEAFSVAMIDATSVTIDIDFIVAERSQYYTEDYRWINQVCTPKLIEFDYPYEICGRKNGDYTPQVITHTIEDFHNLSQIPEIQPDGLEKAKEKEDIYQNPGYQLFIGGMVDILILQNQYSLGESRCVISI